MQSSTGSEFYDQEEVFDTYLSKRARPQSPNEAIEKPVVHALLSDIHGSVLDLGCGHGDLAQELIERGITSYTGIDASAKMIAHCQQHPPHPCVSYHQSSLEDWQYDEQTYDWVIARLVLHYIEDLQTLLVRIHKSLKPNGRLLFSVEHPLLTSSLHLPKPKGKKGDWLVDQYFELGERNQEWLGGRVKKYHRSLEAYWRILTETGFQVEEIKEGCPERIHFQQEAEYERRRRIPLFLMIRAVKR